MAEQKTTPSSIYASGFQMGFDLLRAYSRTKKFDFEKAVKELKEALGITAGWRTFVTCALIGKGTNYKFAPAGGIIFSIC